MLPTVAQSRATAIAIPIEPTTTIWIASAPIRWRRAAGGVARADADATGGDDDDDGVGGAVGGCGCDVGGR